MGRWGFSNDAAEAIWEQHLDNNAFVTHRDQCPTCSAAYKALPKPGRYCDEGNRIFNDVLDDVFMRIEEAKTNGN